MKMSVHHSCQTNLPVKASAFTSIELLVVIVIIADACIAICPAERA